MATVYVSVTEQDREQIRLVLATLKKVVDEMGEDYVYEGDPADEMCFYVRNSQPHCIAARVLFKLGVSVFTLSQCEGMNVQALGSEVTRRTGSFVLNPVALNVLRLAQQIQDRPQTSSLDATWGHALQLVRDAAFNWYGVES